MKHTKECEKARGETEMTYDPYDTLFIDDATAIVKLAENEWKKSTCRWCPHPNQEHDSITGMCEGKAPNKREPCSCIQGRNMPVSFIIWQAREYERRQIRRDFAKFMQCEDSKSRTEASEAKS